MSTSKVQEMPFPAYGAGLILSLIRGEGAAAGRLIPMVLAGLPMSELADLREALDIPMERAAARVGMSRATFHRRQKTGVLSTDESDKALRLARILAQAVAVLGGTTEARAWLSAPQRGLGGAVPLDYAATEIGAREVENLLGRIDYGVYA
jgi:putative toxin-antitoxin system antitoxin component (TIGR02293 family)